MKRLIYSLIAVLALAAPCEAALTAHWKFDDNAATTTLVATVGTNGTLEGGENTDAKDVAGPGGSILAGLDLNGTDDTLQVAGFTLSAGVAGSLSVWFNVDTLASTQRIAGNTSNANGTLGLVNATTINVRPGTSGSAMSFTVPTMSTGTWYHLLVTHTAGNDYRLFLNGIESSTGTLNQTSAWAAITRIGRDSTIFFAGSFAQAKRFDTDESANAAALFSEGKPQNSAVPTVSGTLTIGETLTAADGTWSDGTTTARQWRVADDGSGTNAADISGETGTTYVIDAAEVAAGKYVAVRITRANSIGSTTADSAWSGPVTAAAVAATNSRRKRN